LLFAAVIAWFTGFAMSPHGTAVGETGEHVRTTVATFLRNSAIGTLILCALAGWLLFPARRPRWPARDYAILGIIGVMAATSIYDLAADALGAERAAPHVSDIAVRTGIAPGPAERVVEQLEGLAGRELTNDVGRFRRP
jgi:hypothetical protein